MRLRGLLQPRPLTVVVVVVGTLIVAGALVAVLGRSAPRRLATNNTLSATTATLAGGHEVCQPAQFVPAGAGRVRTPVYADPPERTPLRLTIRHGDRTVSTGGGVLPPKAGFLEARVAPVAHDVEDAVVCLANRGHPTLHLGADYVGNQQAALQSDLHQVGYLKIRFDWFGGDDESWLSFAPTVATRFGLSKASFFGSWTLWACLALLVATSALAVAAAGRARR